MHSVNTNEDVGEGERERRRRESEEEDGSLMRDDGGEMGKNWMREKGE